MKQEVRTIMKGNKKITSQSRKRQRKRLTRKRKRISYKAKKIRNRRKSVLHKSSRNRRNLRVANRSNMNLTSYRMRTIKINDANFKSFLNFSASFLLSFFSEFLHLTALSCSVLSSAQH